MTFPILALTLLMIGDSTTYGTVTGRTPNVAYAPTASVLADLLTHVPAGNQFHNATVIDDGIGGTCTRDWGSYVGSTFCIGHPTNAIVAYACPIYDDLAEASVSVLGQPDYVLVTLGTNDTIYGIPNADAISYLEALSDLMAPAKVLISTPFVTTDATRKAHLDSLVPAMRTAGIVNGPDFYAMPLPLSDPVHLTDGGYAGAAGRWLDTLLALP